MLKVTLLTLALQTSSCFLMRLLLLQNPTVCVSADGLLHVSVAGVANSLLLAIFFSRESTSLRTPNIAALSATRSSENFIGNFSSDKIVQTFDTDISTDTLPRLNSFMILTQEFPRVNVFAQTCLFALGFDVHRFTFGDVKSADVYRHSNWNPLLGAIPFQFRNDPPALSVSAFVQDFAYMVFMHTKRDTIWWARFRLSASTLNRRVEIMQMQEVNEITPGQFFVCGIAFAYFHTTSHILVVKECVTEALYYFSMSEEWPNASWKFEGRVRFNGEELSSAGGIALSSFSTRKHGTVMVLAFVTAFRGSHVLNAIGMPSETRPVVFNWKIDFGRISESPIARFGCGLASVKLPPHDQAGQDEILYAAFRLEPANTPLRVARLLCNEPSLPCRWILEPLPQPNQQLFTVSQPSLLHEMTGIIDES